MAEPKEPAEPTTTCRIAVSVDEDLTALSELRDYPKGWLLKVLLRFAMPRIDLALDDWKHKGLERAWQQSQGEGKRGGDAG